ncbi:MAG: peptide chain release factor N(5)-glutamine methyltransferase [Prevotellaceae bacterium]|jgi:release factor glutamine methyltransferase|nr:peptide chain release factor N(5)-glutamine methyltransferase [Prevotellaceae bacterium]
MTVATLYRQCVRKLQPVYSVAEARALSYDLLSHFAGLSRTHLYAFPDTELTDAAAARIQEGIAALRRHKPLQYITGEALFCGFPIAVNEAVLIPRPETEELVRWVVSRFQPAVVVGSTPNILDICTGSGCIAVALAGLLPAADVHACDISPAALAVAQRNAERNGVAVRVFRYDLLAEPAFDWQVDCIICNPPYVRQSEKAQMSPSILRYEPSEALFVDDSDPLIFYRAIAGFARQYLRAGGMIFMEINEALGNETKALFASCGFTNIELRKDINGRDRMISVEH